MEVLKNSSDVLFILLGAILVLFMHAGFAFLELGTVRNKSQVNALVKILCDFAVSTVAYFFIGYLISIAVFGLYQAIFMANAGGAWDNAKKIVETELKSKGTPLHAATVVGDTVGDPFKDTAGPSLHVLIKLLSTITLVLAPLFI